MLPAADLSSTRPVAASALLRGTATVADPRQDGAVRLDQIALGKALLAQVVSIQSDGSALVRLSSAEQAADFQTELRMQLPAGSKAGDTLNLTLLSKAPQLTFAVSTALPPDTTPTTLSPTARMIDTLLQQAQEAHQSTQVQGARPLLLAGDAASSAMAGKLAQQLRQALDGSGVFYEAHLRQWANGERSLEQVRGEPQNQGASNAPSASQSLSSAQWLPLQLDTLEQQRFTWKGEVWPGQQMQWEVVQQDTSQHSNQAAATPADTWKTVLQLDLPRLGRIKASIRLQGEHAQLQVQAQAPDTAAQLKSQSQVLSDALAASGTALDALTVHCDEQP